MSIVVKNPVEDIAKARPNIKTNTIKQYEINLKKLKKLFDSEDYTFLKKPKDVMDKIADIKYLSQRNILNAIIVLLMALNHDEKYDELIKEYGEERDKLNTQYETENKTGEFISEKQNQNFANSDEIQSMIESMEQKLKPLKKTDYDKWTKKDKALLQAYTIFTIYHKMPMRNDVAGMIAINKRDYNKLSDTEKKENNYLVVSKDKMFFVLNKYKTSKKYEELDLPIDDPNIKKALRYFLKVTDMGVLFKTGTGKPLTRIELSKLLSKYSKEYLNKSVSTTLLRKSYLTNKYGDMKKEMQKDSKVLGHDVANVGMNVYVKENAKKNE